MKKTNKSEIVRGLKKECKCNTEKIFKEDESKKNPGLHLLYVKWAVEHLAKIEQCLKILDCGNLNLLDLQYAIITERDKLVHNNKAYYDAFEILNSIRKIDFIREKYNEGEEEE